MKLTDGHPRIRKKPAALVALLAAILAALSIAASSGAELVKPTLSLGPVTVLNGTATLVGTVNSLRRARRSP